MLRVVPTALLHPLSISSSVQTHTSVSAESAAATLSVKKLFYPEDESNRFPRNTGTYLKQHGVTSQIIIISSYTSLRPLKVALRPSAFLYVQCGVENWLHD